MCVYTTHFVMTFDPKALRSVLLALQMFASGFRDSISPWKWVIKLMIFQPPFALIMGYGGVLKGSVPPSKRAMPPCCPHSDPTHAILYIFLLHWNLVSQEYITLWYTRTNCKTIWRNSLYKYKHNDDNQLNYLITEKQRIQCYIGLVGSSTKKR